MIGVYKGKKSIGKRHILFGVLMLVLLTMYLCVMGSIKQFIPFLALISMTVAYLAIWVLYKLVISLRKILDEKFIDGLCETYYKTQFVFLTVSLMCVVAGSIGCLIL